MANSKSDATGRWYAGIGNLLHGKSRALVAIVALVALGVTARRVWDHLDAELADSPRYKITADVIRTSPDPPPKWVAADVKSQVLRDSGLTESLTLLDEPATIQRRLIDAFELHPWVRSVQRIELAGPRQIDVELEYREPVAVAEITTAELVELLPVDRDAVHLPVDDFTDAELAYLPRITGVEGRPLEGDAWSDRRVRGGVALAGRLGDVWEAYQLLEIVPSSYPEVQRSHRFYVYEIRTNGGTQINWGAAPGFAPPGEDSFETKLARLSSYVNKHGPLGTIDSPQAIDVRDALHVEQRTVRRKTQDKVAR